MEFHEKLQELRKTKGLTQEELAKALYVSRTAISKWESGRGYPSIDSLKQIANYFSVTIDELLSGEKLISLAENENKSNIQGSCSPVSRNDKSTLCYNPGFLTTAIKRNPDI